MRNIFNLFAKSPFAPLQSHMEKVSTCVHLLPSLFDALKVGDQGLAEKIAAEISLKEHEADITKNDIRNHLPKSLFLALDRGSLLDILTMQDSIADRAEDVAVLTSLKPIKLLPAFQASFDIFLKKNLECFDGASAIIHELHELLESSFGGIEADKVRTMVEAVAYREHEADVLQRTLLKDLFAAENELTLSSFHLWQRIIENLSDLSNISEKLAYRIRMTLELK
jgi:predicted phosphate transport protein (TIGR00153 family)